MYVKRQGVPQDYKQAADLFTLAAKQGNAITQNKLALCYCNGGPSYRCLYLTF
jgi:TPR repeat protein